MFADLNADSKAKQFEVPDGKSAIYVYYNYTSVAKWLVEEKYRIWVSLMLDDIGLGDFGWDGYFYWIVDPGQHSIAVTSSWHDDPDRIVIECLKGQILFVEKSWESKGFFAQSRKARLRIISDIHEGQKEILKRRMILDKLTAPED